MEPAAPSPAQEHPGHPQPGHFPARWPRGRSPGMGESPNSSGGSAISRYLQAIISALLQLPDNSLNSAARFVRECFCQISWTAGKGGGIQVGEAPGSAECVQVPKQELQG